MEVDMVGVFTFRAVHLVIITMPLVIIIMALAITIMNLGHQMGEMAAEFPT